MPHWVVQLPENGAGERHTMPEGVVQCKGEPPSKLDFEDCGTLAETEAPSSGSVTPNVSSRCSSVQDMDNTREVDDMRSCDPLEPCWLALRDSHHVIVQMLQRPLVQGHLQGASAELACRERVPSLLLLAAAVARPLGWPAEAAPAAGPPGGAAAAAAPRAPAAAPQLLCKRYGGGRTRIFWTVDLKKLRSKERVLVSPSFELPLACEAPFRMMLQAKVVADKKGGECFIKAKGWGSIHLKCESSMENLPQDACVVFKVSAGRGLWRGPVVHDFAHGGVSGLPRAQQDWDFKAACEEGSQTFLVCLEAVPQG